MKRYQQRPLRMESLENRQLLTSFIEGIDSESRDVDGDLDIYVTNGPGTAAVNQLWGDYFMVQDGR